MWVQEIFYLIFPLETYIIINVYPDLSTNPSSWRIISALQICLINVNVVIFGVHVIIDRILLSFSWPFPNTKVWSLS